MAAWLLLHYKVMREPSANRVYIWRKLKRLGAILLHDAVWVLPDTARTREQFQWLAAEIAELEGEAFVWQSQLLPGGQAQEAQLVEQFKAQVETGYQQILTELAQIQTGDATDPPDLKKLARYYQQLQQQDYFHSALGKEVVRQLEAASRGKEGATEGREEQ